jgi:hypothetical protein
MTFRVEPLFEPRTDPRTRTTSGCVRSPTAEPHPARCTLRLSSVWVKVFRTEDERSWRYGNCSGHSTRRFPANRVRRRAHSIGVRFIVRGHPRGHHVGAEDAPRKTVMKKTAGLLILFALIAAAYVRFRSRPAGEPQTAETPKSQDAASTAQPPAAPPAAEKRDSASQRPPQNGAPANRPAPPGEVSFPASHKHRLRDCHGVLTFSRQSVRYVARDSDDSFTYPIAGVKLHENGFDAGGKRWHFEIRGRDAQKIFKDWKAGRLHLRKN